VTDPLRTDRPSPSAAAGTGPGAPVGTPPLRREVERVAAEGPAGAATLPVAIPEPGPPDPGPPEPRLPEREVPEREVPEREVPERGTREPGPPERVTPIRAEPTGPAERWLDVDGSWVHTVEWRPAAETHPPVVLVHGLGGSVVNWWLTGPALASALGARTIAVDLIGFGRTRTDGRTASLGVNGRMVAGVLDRIGPATLVGNSMGGAIAVGVAARRPELVTGLVLVDPALPRPPGTFDQWQTVVRFAGLTVPMLATPVVAARMRRMGPVGIVDGTMGLSMRDASTLDPDVRTRMIELATQRAAMGGESPRAYTQAAASLVRYVTGPMRRDVEAVGAPTLLVHGTRDRLVPVSFARAVARSRPDWALAELDGCGHVPQLERPAELTGLISGWAAGR